MKMTTNKLVVDLDDFCEENTDWDLILKLKKAVPNLKLNLFTIPGKCSWQFIEEMRKIEWINLLPHGHIHSSSRECENWSYPASKYHLQSLEREGWIKIWKSPGWQTSDNLFMVLKELDWVIADQEYNNERRPQGLRAYLLDSPYKIHGHIGHWGGGFNSNSLQLIFDSIAGLKGEFAFINELMAEDEIQEI